MPASPKIPVIDPNVRYVGPSALRELNGEALRSMKKTMVVSADGDYLAVVMPYSIFVTIQTALAALNGTPQK